MLRSLRSALVSLAAMVLLAGAMQSLDAQGIAPPTAGASEASTHAPAPDAVTTTPAPRPSTLFERPDDRAPTLAAAREADAESRSSSGRHTFTMSTTVLILVVVLLVILID